MQIWAADGEAGLMVKNGAEYVKIGPPGEALCPYSGRVFCAGRGECRGYRPDTGEILLSMAVPGGICAMAAFGGRLCALSSEADCLCALCPRTGEMHFSTPAGNYPRGLCLSPCGRFLAVAGGASGEALLFDQQLCCLQQLRLPGVCCGICFLARGMAALCAVGEGELSSRLMHISPRGVIEEMLAFPDVPCSLCALPGGGCLAGFNGQVIGLRPDGRIFLRLPVGYPACIRHLAGCSMICDLSPGRIITTDGTCIYRGPAPWDVLALPTLPPADHCFFAVSP